MSRSYPWMALAIGFVWMPAGTAAERIELETSLISASALPRQHHEMTTPAEVLEEDALIRRRAATLAETLNGLPGVQAAGVGAGASLPVIRGLDGGRVKVLSDGVDVMDASTVSQ